jgi:hypothetical protein
MFAMVGGATAHAAPRFGRKSRPLAEADGRDIDPGRLGETGDRGGDKSWHGAGFAFDVTIKPPDTGKARHPLTFPLPK